MLLQAAIQQGTSQGPSVFNLIEGAFMTLLTIVGFLARNKMKEYDDHLEKCHTKDIDYGKLDQRVTNMESQIGERFSGMEGQIDGVVQTGEWIGDCVMRIGGKMNIDLPRRPYKQ